MKTAVRLGLLALTCAAGLFAQDIYGNIAGTVMDPSGSAVPRAKVIVLNTDRNQEVRTVTTDAAGNYSAPLLPIGSYAINVEASGFKIGHKPGIKLNVNDKLTVNVTLEVGNVTDSVTVQESSVQVELSTPATAGVMEGKDIRELQISTRNYEQLVGLMPGVSTDNTEQLFVGGLAPSGLANTMPYSVNGQRNSANNWTVDGADNVDRGSNLTLLNYPSVDAIEQFKVERSLYTADSGRAGGAQINVVTRGGTSKFHGSLYEFVRNDAFVANNWINNANKVNMINQVDKALSCTGVNALDCKAVRTPLRWNNFGGTVGGPLYIPGLFNKNKNKTFFFYSQEFRRIHTYTTFNSTIPTLNERQGIFATPVCLSPQTGGCPAGSTITTQIPASLIHPVAAAYVKDIFSKLPAPTSGNTLFNPQPNVYNHRQELARFDEKVSDRFAIWGRLIWDTIPTVEPGGLFTASPIPNGATTSTNSPGHGVTVRALYAFSANKLNEVGYSYSYGAILSTPIGLTAKQNAPDINVNVPFPNTMGVVTAASFTGGSSIVGVGPYNDYNKNHAFLDNFTWIHGAHTLKFGATYNRYRKYENSPNGNNYGTMAFTSTGVQTGTGTYQQSLANFLLGNVATYTQASRDFTADVRAIQTEAYAQDDFRIRPNLTVYFGVRWSYFGQPADGGNVLSNFDPSQFDNANAQQINPTNGQIISGTGKALNGIIIGGQNSPYGSKVANDIKKNFAPRFGISWDPFGTGRTAVKTGYGIYYDASLFGTYEQNIFTNPPLIQNITISNVTMSNPGGGTSAVSLNPLALRGTPVPNGTPYTQQWSLAIQHQLQKDFVVDVGYFGSKGTHLLGIIDINQLPPGFATAAGVLPANANGSTVWASSGDEARLNGLRPYRGYNAINVVRPWFKSNYHSLQVQVRKRLGRGGNVNMSYTWSHNMSDNASDRSNAPQNTYNFHEGEYGPARLDRRQVLSFYYYYELPMFKHSKGLVGGALKGWQISGNTTMGTGLPFSVATSNADPAGLGLLGSSASSARPDQVCDPNQNAPHQYGSAAETTLLWFNTACFQPVPSGQIRPGNAGRFTIRGPGYQTWNASMFKNFRFGEKGRYQVQVRGEATNFANHPVPFGIGSANNTSTLFGKITSFRDPRIIQLGAKLYF
jgi:hypothetical protein